MPRAQRGVAAGLGIALAAGCTAIVGVQTTELETATSSSGSGTGTGGKYTSSSGESASSGSSGPSSSGCAGGSGTDGGTPPCLTMCDGSCVDPTSNPRHCGSCNVKCGCGVPCLGGVCGRSLYRGPGADAPCAAKPNGTLYCWGGNADFQVGTGSDCPPAFLTPHEATVVNDPVRYTVTTGEATCALLRSGGVTCFGANSFGEMGIGTLGGPVPCTAPYGCYASGIPAKISGVVELSGAAWWCGGTHLCARKADGTVWCWGDMGNCYNGGQDLVKTPEIVQGLDGVVELASGTGYDCALRVDGTVWCWGDNTDGQLGQGDTSQHPGVVKVPGLVGVTMIGSGLRTVCARAPSGLYCWGANSVAMAGVGPTDGGLNNVTTPTLIAAPPGFEDVVQVTGSQQTTCALTASGSVFCWGNVNLVGNSLPGDPACLAGACTATPTSAKIDHVVEISMGIDFVLARVDNGALMAWGADGADQLGTATTSTQVFPTPVVGFP